jgi:hypothetical protein
VFWPLVLLTELADLGVSVMEEPDQLVRGGCQRSGRGQAWHRTSSSSEGILAAAVQ